jgi:hypothetical protein
VDPIIFIPSLVAAAIFVVALAHISVLMLELPKRNRRDGDSKPHQQDAIQGEHKAVSADFTALINAITKEGGAGRDEEKREDDEKKLREWITIGLIALTLGVLGWQVGEMVKVYDPVKAQADAAERNLVAANRAWVEPASLILEKPLEQGGSTEIGLFITNRGREPAVDVLYALKLRSITYIKSGAPSNDESVEEPLGRNQTCDALEPKPGVGFVLYPGIDRQHGVGYSFPENETNTGIRLAALSRSVSIVVDGCLAYHTFDQSHFSAFRFLLRDVPGPSCWIVHPTPGVPSPAGIQTPDGVMRCWDFQVMLTGNKAS